MSVHINQQVKVPQSSAGSRLDQVAAELFPDFSRSRLQSWIKRGELNVDGLAKKPNSKLGGGETLDLRAELESSEEWLPEALEFEVVYEDASVIVVNKPRSMVVHPAAGNWRGTLLNGLIHRYPELTQMPRAGIVHRLDKDTTGLMVVARDLGAQVSLVEQLQSRSVSRTYWAIAQGDLTSKLPRHGSVKTFIGRHPTHRTKMAVVKSGGKEAITHYEVKRRFNDSSLLELKLETGRTHQIRVHMAHLGHPLIGDVVYGKPSSDPECSSLSRQALHAKKLGFVHPVSGKQVAWETQLPDDIADLYDTLVAR